MIVKPNPITRRVVMLSNQWRAFASDRHARVLCWQLALDEVRMVEAFLALELDERTANHSDLFVTLETAFESGPAHGETLRDELVALYESEGEALRAEGLAAGWAPPSVADTEPGLRFFVRSCVSFAAHHALPRHLVVVLRPKLVREDGLYQQWLGELAREAPANLRVVIFDTAQPAGYASLLEPKAGEACRVVARAAQLDMPAAFEEISQSAGKLDTPGGEYRALFLQLSAALGDKDMPRALQLGESALAVAAAQNWFHMSVPIRAALGGALAAEGRFQEAQAQYLAAEQSALRGQTEGSSETQPVCKKLRLQARLGLGSVLIAGELYDEAAAVFEQTLPLALESGEDAVLLDCYRLASFCHERTESGGSDAAFRWALDGVRAAKPMSAETLAISSFPYLAEALLRLCEATGRSSRRSELEREIAACGRESQPQPRAAAAPSAPG